MMPTIRNGFAATMDKVAAWWRGREVRRFDAPRFSSPPAFYLAPAPNEAPERHAEVALRRFLGFALDVTGESTDAGEVDEAHEPLIAAASATLARLEMHAKYLPRRPSLLPRLLSAMNQDSNSMRELAVIIGGDPTLLGNLLRVANSVFYRPTGKPVDSLQRAVTLVGTDGIRSVIATALMHPVMSSGTGWFARFPETVWEQTQYSADAAEAHALAIEGVDGFSARMLALLHGLATNTVFRIVRDAVVDGRHEAAKPAVVRLLDTWVVPTAQRIAVAWDLPPELQAVLAAEPREHPLGRSLSFGRLAGSQIVMVRRGRIKESSARAIVLASDPRRMQLDRLWNRLAVACRKPS
jgi:HD-like signal output (HDOD) protein